MKTYKVTIDFKGAPSFSTEIGALSEVAAKSLALRSARASGWSEPVAKSAAVEIASVPA